MQEYIKRTLGSDHNKTTLTTSNNEIEDIIKIIKSLEHSELLFEGVSETIKNEAKEQKAEFLSMLLSAGLLGNILAGKRINRAGYGNKKGKGVIRVGY